MNKTECPEREKHTPCPEGYIAWHIWAARMGKTHRQIKCPMCGLYSIWIPKVKREKKTEIGTGRSNPTVATRNK